MRLPIAILLALPASFLSTLVAATPSPIFNHEPLSPPVQEKSHWRILSNKLIDVIWGTTQQDGSHRRPERQTVLSSSDDVVLRFNVSSDAEIKALAEAAETLLLDVWEFSREWVDIRLSADIVHPLLGLLPKTLQHAHTPLLREKELAKAIHDTFPTSLEEVQARIFDRKASFNPSRSAANGPENNIFFADYQPLSVIGPWMRLLSTLFSSHVTLIDIGRSHEDRPIHALRVGVHATNDKVKDPPKRKTVLVTGGLHAREWIGVSTVNYIAYSLITGYGKTPSITRLLEEFDFVFVPTVNPDGYVYTWETDRLWRKNRQETGNRFCQGIDLDRAFSFKWDGLTTTIGNPCSESFAGETPFEAVESRQLADWARNQTGQNNVEFVGFLDLHSYSQEILFPYSYSCDATPPGLENLQELAFGLEKAIRVTHGHTYEVMPACEGNVAFSSSNKKTRFGPRMEAAGGSALDYFYHEVGVKYAYQIKLRDKGNYGFLLPSENIVPTGKEILEAVLYLGNFLNEAYNAVGHETKDVPQVDLRRR